MGRKLGTPVPEEGWKIVLKVLGLKTRQEVANFLSSRVSESKKLSPHAVGWWKRKINNEVGLHVPLKYLYVMESELSQRAESDPDGGRLERSAQILLRNSIRQNERERNGKPTTDLFPPEMRKELEAEAKAKAEAQFLEDLKMCDERTIIQELQRRGWKVTLELKETV